MTIILRLSDVITRLQQHPSLSPARRRDLVSAILRICDTTGVDPRITPAAMQFMRPLINAVRPAKHNLRPKTWSNLCSNFRAAVVHALPRQTRNLNQDWERLRTALPQNRFRSGLSRFIGFCEREAISPGFVTGEVLARFRAYLETDTLVPSPPACHRRTAHLWNAAANSVPGWPQVLLRLPDHRRARQSLPINRFPVTLQEEVEWYLASPIAGDRFAKGGPQPPRRPATVRKIRIEIELALSALVASGREPASITSLKCLVEPDALETALRRYLKADMTPRPIAHNLASTVIALATRLAGSDPIALDKLTELRRLRRCLGPQRKGLTEKNRVLLRTLADPDVRAKLLFLPEALAHFAERATPSRGAVAMGLAVAIAILQSAPLRIANLAALRLDRHLMRPGGPRSLWHIDIPPHEVKNEVPLVYELPRRVTALLDRYIRRFRPLLAEPGNGYLFPAGPRHKSPAGFSQQIRGIIADWIGIDMTPQQFRHWAGMLMQQHSPGAFASIAQLLGHKHVETAQAYYTELDTLSVGRQFDAIVEAERAKTTFSRRIRS